MSAHSVASRFRRQAPDVTVTRPGPGAVLSLSHVGSMKPVLVECLEVRSYQGIYAVDQRICQPAMVTILHFDNLVRGQRN
jgi:hypothetical protein